jgi:hypothetical protein
VQTTHVMSARDGGLPDVADGRPRTSIDFRGHFFMEREMRILTKSCFTAELQARGRPKIVVAIG